MRLPVWLSLAATILLLGFELPMLAIGLFGAQVSPAYRAFFIERRTDLWAGETAAAFPDQPRGRINR